MKLKGLPMRNWIAKFRISAAADSGKPLPASLREDIACTDELRRFDQTLAGMDRALRNSVPKTEPPPGLHNSIMSAVRAASQPALKPGRAELLLSHGQKAAQQRRPTGGMVATRGSWTLGAFPELALRWLAVPALAALVLAGGFWWAKTRPVAPATAQAASTAKPWSMPTAALEQGRELARNAPAVAIAPLAEELARADRDFRTAAQFLLASLP
jgi:hypothetical protein